MDKTAYRKVYRIRSFGRGGYEVTVPGIILDRAARARGMTIEEFAKSHRIVHLFNDFEGFDAAYRFEKAEVSDTEILEFTADEMQELGIKTSEHESPAEAIARVRKLMGK